MNFSETERYIKNLFQLNQTIKFNNITYKILLVGKPTCTSGEPKTDIYLLLQNLNDNNKCELKISVKKTNADFLENKISAKRAQAILGSNWAKIIKDSTESIKEEFMKKPLIYKEKSGRTNAGSITLGWRFEFVNKDNGALSSKMKLTLNQVIDVYSGSNLPQDKKDAKVNGQVFKNSGIASSILIGNIEDFNSAQDIIDKIVPIEVYTKNNPDIYFACKALNYRTFDNKYEGNRPLSVYVDWNVVNNKLTPTIKFDSPLITTGKTVVEQLKKSLKQLSISTTDDINSKNVSSESYVFINKKKEQ